MMQVTLIPREHVKSIWPQVLPHAEKAAEYSYGRYGVEDILDSIEQYNHDLWLAFNKVGINEVGIKGMVVTVVKPYPKKTCLDMVFCAGDDGMEWKDSMLKVLK